MKHKHLLAGLFCSLYVLGASLISAAQPSGIAVKLLSYNITPNNVANIGYTITISAEVTNEDTVLFAGQLDFGLRNNTFDSINDPNVFNKPSYSGTQIVLNPGEVVPAIFSVEIDAQYFAPGPDVVVVWPISNKPITDSVLININVQNPNGFNGVDEIPFAYSVQNGELWLRYDNADINFQQVRIFDLYGRLIFAVEGDLISVVNVDTLMNGIYICEVYTSDKKRKAFKFVQ